MTIRSTLYLSLGNKHGIKSNFSIDSSCFNKINGACLVSGRVNSAIQFPPEVELHRQRLEGGVCVRACVRACVRVCVRACVCSCVGSP